MTTLVTPRLSLSIPCDEDRPDFRALSADPEVMRYFPKVQSADESDALVARCRQSFAQRGFGYFTVRTRRDGAFVGFVGLGVPSFEAAFMPCVEVGWRLCVAAWGQGYATESATAALRFGFEEHGLAEIVSFTSVVNEPSRAVMRRLGMVHDEAGAFDHPRIARGDRLERHVLYRLSREAHGERMAKGLS